MNDEEQRKQFAMMIADVIQELLKDSEELSAILEEANAEGYDIFLTILSGIMIRRREETDPEKVKRFLRRQFYPQEQELE